MTPEQLASWGWRLPFLMGAFVAFTGYLVRHGIHAPEIKATSKKPVRDTFGKHRWDVIRVALLNAGLGVGGLLSVCLFSVLHSDRRQPARKPCLESQHGLHDSAAGDLAALRLASRLVRSQADVVGGSAVLTLGAIPFFHLMHSANAYQIFLGECGFVVGLGMFSAGVAAGNVKLMPSSIRCTGLAFAYNASIGLMGGSTPLISAWLIAETANPISQDTGWPLHRSSRYSRQFFWCPKQGTSHCLDLSATFTLQATRHECCRRRTVPTQKSIPKRCDATTLSGQKATASRICTVF
ncbi:MAG: hypothetical protein ACR2OA_03725 [Rubripirellula sp.]